MHGNGIGSSIAGIGSSIASGGGPSGHLSLAHAYSVAELAQGGVGVWGGGVGGGGHPHAQKAPTFEAGAHHMLLVTPPTSLRGTSTSPSHEASSQTQALTWGSHGHVVQRESYRCRHVPVPHFKVLTLRNNSSNSGQILMYFNSELSGTHC